MSGMGIYGLSGSGIDVDSMVKMGMMNKQNQYDKLYKQEVKNEWIKEAYADMYNSINTFNSSTLYNYKMSSTTSPMSAESTNTSVATAAANADAASMTHTVNVSATASNAYLLTNGSINRANTSSSSANKSIYLKDILFNEATQNSLKAQMESDSSLAKSKLISFTIADGTGKGSNSKEVSFTYEEILSNNETLNDLVSSINNAGVNIKAAYDSANDAFSLYQKTGGSSNKIIFSVDTGTAAINGKALISSLNLGVVSQVVDSSGNLNSELSSPLNFEATTGNSSISATSFNSSAELAADTILNTLFNTSASSNTAKFTLSNGTDTAEITIDDVSTATVQDLMDAINGATKSDGTTSLGIKAELDGSTLKISHTDSADTNTISFTVANTASDPEDVNGRKLVNGLQLSTTELTASTNGIQAAGTDAQVTIDGRSYTSDTGKITVGNVTYTLAAKGSTTVTVNQDTDKLIENVKKFVEDYNKMLDSLNDKYYETKYSDYGVLTKSQENGMTKEQIEKWNEKAKSGLLNHDDNIGKIISEMREAIYTPVDSVTGSYNTLMSIGIGSKTDRGHLYLDEDKLKKALAAEPDCVRQLFTATGEKTDSKGNTYTDYKSEGVVQRISDSLYKNLKTMKSYAGTSTETSDGSTLGDLIRELQTKMSNFKTMMKSYENMLYKKYDAMETAIQRLSVSMGYITGGQ
ncbi:flagellar filament capping protein FliD [Selenomonas ruminantium]|uniref:Flagellar hook-associated protein 2 n=1 Tax=Selenomonas ruminantium TaxID=971 RepID=A0A1I0YGK7_SELRU|nr:flagellar filament capping protein FliD [Selenomonas ruminantium]SFB11630.1 flagellar hook-associated protein 2 [Selenomonas ruminantium]